MTIPERIYSFLRERTPKPVCDDCLAKHNDVSQRQTVNTIASALALTTDFDRREATCSMCQNEKLVTRSLRYA